jgi:DNA-binding FadR family transcriptional regulator
MPELRRRTLSQTVSEQLLARVRTGELRPGERLPTEQGLMEEFGVGRNVAREAVQHLVALGVVDVRPRRGAVVSAVDADGALDALAVGALLEGRTVDDLYEFRMLLETAIAERAAERAGPDDLARVEAGLRAFEDALLTRTDIFAADVAFHQRLAEASGNVIYARVLDTLTDLLELYRRQTDRVPGAPEAALVEHTAIVEAIRRADPAGARTAMERHIRTAVETLGRARDRQRPEGGGAEGGAPEGQAPAG